MRRRSASWSRSSATRWRELIGHPVQTNEPGRSAALMGGFLEVARQTGLPLRLLEVGASAGLNLRWDRYFYTAPGGIMGRPGLAGAVRPRVRRGRAAAARAARRSPSAAAATPIRSTRPTDDDQLTLLSYVWPDQEQRVAPAARRARGRRRGAGRDRPRRRGRVAASKCSREPRAGVATVVFHSVVLPYLGEQGIADLKRTIEEAGARATRRRAAWPG